MSPSLGRCWDTSRPRQTPRDTFLSVLTRQSIQDLTASTYRDDWVLMSTVSSSLGSTSKRCFIISPQTQFSPWLTDWLTGNHLGPLFSLSVATGCPGACWLRSGETKEAVMANFILSSSVFSPQSSAGQMICEGDTGQGTIFLVGGGEGRAESQHGAG